MMHIGLAVGVEVAGTQMVDFEEVWHLLDAAQLPGSQFGDWAISLIIIHT